MGGWGGGTRRGGAGEPSARGDRARDNDKIRSLRSFQVLLVSVSSRVRSFSLPCGGRAGEPSACGDRPQDKQGKRCGAFSRCSPFTLVRGKGGPAVCARRPRGAHPRGGLPFRVAPPPAPFRNRHHCNHRLPLKAREGRGGPGLRRAARVRGAARLAGEDGGEGEGGDGGPQHRQEGVDRHRLQA